MEVIEPITLSEDPAVNENVVDTTLVYDWGFRNQQWIRRCRIVAKEFKTGATDENNLSPTSSFASAHVSHLCTHLHFVSDGIGRERCTLNHS